MSYDLIFARRGAGQSWDDILETMEEVEDDTTLPDAEVWRRLVGRAQEQLGHFTVFDSELVHEIDHEPTSVQLTLFRDAAEMHVPYGATGADAVRKLTTMYQLAHIVVEQTGLECYDPQVERPLRAAAADPGLGLASFEAVAHMFGRRGAAIPQQPDE